MTATINILQNKFGGSENLPIFVVPNRAKISKSEHYISYRLNTKADLLRQFYFGSLARFGDFQGRFASFCTYISQIFSPQMPNRGKNLKADALGVSASTTRNRHSAPVIKKSLLTQSPKSDAKRPITPYSALKAAEPKKRTWRISLNCTTTSTSTNLRTVGIYHTDLYEATSQDEAVGIAVQVISRRFPFFSVDLGSVKCSTLNPATL